MAKLISADLTNNKLCILEYTTIDGQMLSFKEDAFDAKIVSHTHTDIGKVIFDKPITKIGDSAFSDCKSLTSVTTPDSVTTIGEGA
ncbi:MAG: leucine-rich repeat protein, partial [Rikenellaceae bacterium]|nr:leucine-rich repeat protein [Rikenellaceae bacterium]